MKCIHTANAWEQNCDPNCIKCLEWSALHLENQVGMQWEWKGIEQSKVDVHKSNTTIIWTPKFEWSAVRCGSKDGQRTGLHAQNVLWPRDLYDHLMSTRIFHFDNEQDIYMRCKNYETNLLRVGQFGFANGLAQIALFHINILQEVGGERNVSTL